MSTDFSFGPTMENFGRDVLRELVRTDFGPGSSVNGINGHELKADHHGGMHDQVNLWQSGVKDSGIVFRFFQE